ncbi:MAG: CvpA family protein [Bacteroidota bacterium]
MTFLDFLILIPIGWLGYKGFSKGLIMEIFSLAALLVGLYACIHFTDWTAGWLKETFTESWASAAICVYIITFCGAFAAVYFGGKLVEGLFKAGGMGVLNKLGGALIGALKAVLILSALLVAVNTLNAKKDFIGKSTREKSLLYEPVSKFGTYILPAYNNSEWVSKYL